jgi:hypothetical protein
MYCILYLKTNIDIDEFSNNLVQMFGERNSTEEIFAMTSLSGTEFLPLYFYGVTNQTTNFLFSKETSNKLRIFVESVSKKDNLDQLVNGVRNHFINLNEFFDTYKIKLSDISGTIWSEEEEILKGEFQGYWKNFKSNIPDLPTGIYLSVLTIVYSIAKPADTTESIKSKIVTALINLLIALISIILWLFIKAGKKKENLVFKIK